MRKINPKPRKRAFMYTQDLDHLPFDDDKLKTILERSSAVEWAYILHDKDTNVDGKLKRKHYHVVIKFKDAKTINSIAKLFDDKPQYVEAWKGNINNAYSYLIHETNGSTDENKYQYNENEVVASFDFPTRMKQIRRQIKQPNKTEMQLLLNSYAMQEITRDQLREKIGPLFFAKQKQLIDKITQVILEEQHDNFLKEYHSKCRVYWIYGEAGVGKTRLSREICEKLYPNDFKVLGSARDHFQEYGGEGHVILNDLRPFDYKYSELLQLLDPWEHDKMAPSRYHDKPLNLRVIFITTPYSVKNFYDKYSGTLDPDIDTINQLQRRVTTIRVTADTIEKVKNELIKKEKKQLAIEKIKSKKNVDQIDSK